MAELISLFRYQKQTRSFFYPYVIFQTHAPKALQCLSPDIMQLTDCIYVADLTIVQSYWQKVANKKSLSVSDLLESVIQKSLPDCPLSLFCEHPFQGLVFFNHLKDQEARGCFQSHSLFAEKVYRHMGWHPWFFAARQLHDCFEKVSCLKKERQGFSSQLARMSRFVEKVDLQEFSALKQAHFFEVARRFKGFLGLLWKWTFPARPDDSSSSSKKQSTQFSFTTFSHYEQLQGFPWVPFFAEEEPQVSHLLEYPVSEWEALKDHLLADLEKLADSPELQPPFKVLHLQWQITLFDLSLVQEDLFLKSPLSFSDDRNNDFDILMKQLHFAFEQFQQKLQDKADELQIINTPLIVGWKLSVKKRLRLSEKADFLDVEEQLQKLKNEDLLNLSNKVKSGIQSFEVFETFIPGFDFSTKDLLTKTSHPLEDALSGPRPFYLFSKEEELDETEIISSQFLDRTSSDWWNRQEALDSYRDCFLCELKSKEYVFAYRNHQGKWFCYGV